MNTTNTSPSAEDAELSAIDTSNQGQLQPATALVPALAKVKSLTDLSTIDHNQQRILAILRDGAGASPFWSTTAKPSSSPLVGESPPLKF